MIKKVLRLFLRKLQSQLNKVTQNEPVFPSSDSIHIGEGFTIGNLRSIIVDKKAHILIEENVGIRQFANILAYKGSSLTIRKNVYCSNYFSVNCLGKITIGENTLIGEGVKIYDHNHKYAYNNNILTVERDDFNISEVYIGSNCWIGSNVTILRGAIIGDNVIIGANNLIYKSIPAGTIVKSKSDLLFEPFAEKR